MSKYQRWYDAITSRGQESRELDYKERHHIIPKCLNGTDDSANITELTAREHFIAHWLLTKIHTTGKERYLLLNALQGMRRSNPNQDRYDTPITSRVYSNLKEEWSKLSSDRVSGENNPMYGDKFHRSEEGRRRQREAVSGEKNGAKQPEAREKISESKRDRKRPQFSEEWLAKITASNQGEKNGMYGKTHSEETRKKIGDKIRGRVQTEEEKKRRGEANLGRVREKKLCPHCQREIAVNGYARFHGDKCKEKP